MVAQWRLRWGGIGMEAGRPARMMLQLSSEQEDESDK